MTSDNSRAPELIWAAEDDFGGRSWHAVELDNHLSYTLTSTIPQWNTDMDSVPSLTPVFVVFGGEMHHVEYDKNGDGLGCDWFGRDTYNKFRFSYPMPWLEPTQWMHITPPEEKV